ncbi:hypothetical protein JCGZ_08738 [Jatropha curcas]|uniref:MADS-box domain-containing protein n=1 Tax=Jatropha curcas TaxID=180498 RepID=A0A067KW68_JATCU|nr:agamous-like MADS-box protein AGL86 [Jatropha curcas]KDP36094.1 hypothetical protein JCGZ_08738 [Jatropha curcas]
MTRKKVKLVWIVNDAARKASLKKRRIGLLKKVSELTTLCGVSAFVIIYSPDETEPMIWPSRPLVEQLLMRYQNIPEIERCKKMMNQESYLKERVAKVHEQSRKNQRKNREVEMSYLMDKLHKGNGADDFEFNELQVLIWLLEEKMKDLRKRVEYFQQVPPLPPTTSFFPPLPPPNEGPTMQETGHKLTTTAGAAAGGGSGGGGGGGGVDAVGVVADDGGGGGDIRNSNLGDTMTWDQWYLDIINNNDDNLAGGTKNNMMAHHPYGYNITLTGGDIGFPTGSTGNIFSLSLPSSNMNIGGGGNHFEMGQQSFHSIINSVSGHPFRLGLQPYQGNVDGNNGGNGIGLGMPPLATEIEASDPGMQGHFAGGSDIGPPYDVTKPWYHNFAP